MAITIESYSRDTGELMKVMAKSMAEYSEWCMRAANRGYSITTVGKDLLVHGGRGKRYFLVLDVNANE